MNTNNDLDDGIRVQVNKFNFVMLKKTTIGGRHQEGEGDQLQVFGSHPH
jgi:hypothetical protein